MKHSEGWSLFILFRFYISRKTMMAFFRWLPIFFNQPEKQGLLNFTDSSEMPIIIRRIIKRLCLILKNIQLEQKPVPGRINTSLDTVIIKPAKLIEQLRFFLK